MWIIVGEHHSNIYDKNENDPHLPKFGKRCQCFKSCLKYIQCVSVKGHKVIKCYRPWQLAIRANLLRPSLVMYRGDLNNGHLNNKL